MRLDWLPDVLRDAGVPIHVMGGALTRGRSMQGMFGIVWHHTVTGPHWQDGHVAAMLRDGHRHLAGPLSQVGIERSGVWVIVATGRANHNGYGEWGNNSLGLEFYNDGVGEPYRPAQYESGIIGTAAVLRHLGRAQGIVKGHKETDPRRKIDPLLDMNTVRAHVRAHLLNPTTPAPPSTEEPFTVGQYEDIMEKLEGLRWLAAAAADHSKIASDRSVPAATQRETARNVKRIGHKLGIETIEGGDPDAPSVPTEVVPE
jgi:hypothetical protein